MPPGGGAALLGSCLWAVEVVQCVWQCHTQPQWLCLAEIWALVERGVVCACVLLSVVVGGWWVLMHDGTAHHGQVQRGGTPVWAASVLFIQSWLAAYLSTCGLVAMTSASHAEGRQFDPGQVYCFC